MKHAVRNDCARSRCIALVLGLALAACGGGGGDGAPGGSDAVSSSGNPADSAGGIGAGIGGTGAGTSAPGVFTAFGPVTVAAASTVPGDGAGQGPRVARLAGGGAVVTWLSGPSLLAQQVDAGGRNVGAPLEVARLSPPVRSHGVTGLANGDWVVAWASSTVPQDRSARAFTKTVQTRRYGGDGTLLQDTTLVDPTVYSDVDPELNVKATADGGHVVAWSGSLGLAAPREAFFRRFPADGAAAGEAAKVSGIGGDQSQLQVAPLSDGSVVIAWLQGAGGGANGGSGFAIHTRRFGAGSDALGPEQVVQASAAASTFQFAATRVAGDRVAVLWSQPVGDTRVPIEARWQLLDPDGSAATPMGAIAVAPVIDDLEIAPSGAGFTGFVQDSTATGRVFVARLGSFAVDGNGALQGGIDTLARRNITSVSPTTGDVTGPAGTRFSVDGAADDHFAAAYDTAIAGGAEVDVLGR